MAKQSGKAKKKRVSAGYLWLVVGVSVVLAAIIIPNMALTIGEGLVGEIVIRDVDMDGCPDGVYPGTFSSAHFSASVNVTVIDEQVVNIEVTGQTGLQPARVQDVIDRVVYYQSLIIPEPGYGNQTTDKIILKAIERALTGSQ